MSEGSAVHVVGVHFWVGELVVEGAPGSRLGWEAGEREGFHQDGSERGSTSTHVMPKNGRKDEKRERRILR